MKAGAQMEDKQKTKQPEHTLNSLKESLRCANQEAQGYLDSLHRAEASNNSLREELKRITAELNWSRRVGATLFRIVEADYKDPEPSEGSK
jgi:septal ring factor EnvC (AmiA/AmiB activator)